MEIYIKLFEVLFPVFFVVGIGYYLGKKNPKIDTTFITNFAANVGTPAMIIYALNPVNISFDIFINYFWYYAIAIFGFMITGIIILYLLSTKDIIRELPPLTMPNTGNMGLPICLFAYGSQGLGVSAAISALIILCHFTLGDFLADRKFSLNVILKSPPFYAIIVAVILLYFDLELPGFVENTTFLLMYATIFLILMSRLWFSDAAPLASTLGILLLTQITLGIINVVYVLPLYVAIAHNLVAACLLLAMFTVNYLAWKK